MLKITRKNTLLLGTLILTASGIICRILGFLYRIFLSRRIGAEAFGIYQLATPLYALMLSLGAGGMQTVLSRFVASYLAKKDSRRAKICLAAGCGIVVILSFSASIFLFFSADFIGTRLLFEPRTILLLRILSLGILPSGIHNCLSAWYLGQNQTALPSFCQLLEQFVRMGASYLAWLFCLSTSLPSAAVAAFGTAAGELFSISSTVRAGLAMVSPNTAFVFGRNAAFSSSAEQSGSTKVHSTPMRFIVTENRL